MNLKTNHQLFYQVQNFRAATTTDAKSRSRKNCRGGGSERGVWIYVVCKNSDGEEL